MDWTATSAALVALALPALAWVLLWLWAELKSWLQWRSIPGPAGPHWLLGHGLQIADHWLSACMLEWERKHGPLVATRVGPVRVFFLSHPQEASKLLRKGPDCLPKAPAIYDIYTAMTGAAHRNILTEPDGAMHSAIRKAALPAFGAASLRAMVPRIVGLTQQAADIIEGCEAGAAVDIQDICERINCDVIATITYGEDQGSVVDGNNEYLNVVRDMTEAAHRFIGDPVWQLSWVWSCRARQDWQSCRRFNEYAYLLTLRMKQAHEAGRLPPFCVGGLLLEAKDPNTGKPLSLRRIGVELGTLASAGFEAASHGAAWALALLALHPEAQQHLVAELDAAELLVSKERPEPRAFVFEDCAKIRYLAAVIQEALRMFPPDATGTARSTPPDRAIEVCGHKVPPKSIIICAPYPMGLSKANYGVDALSFDPMRWLAHLPSEQAPGTALVAAAPSSTSTAAEMSTTAGTAAPAAAQQLPSKESKDGCQQQQQEKQRQQHQHQQQGTPLREAMPFSLGRRDCIAQALARVEMQAIVATIVSRFVVEPAPELLTGASSGGFWPACPDPSSMVPLRQRAVYHINLTAKDGLPLVFKPRA